MALNTCERIIISRSKFNFVKCSKLLILILTTLVIYTTIISLCSPIDSITNIDDRDVATSGISESFRPVHNTIPKRYVSKRSQHSSAIRKLTKRAATSSGRASSTTTSKPIINLDDVPEGTRELYPEQIQSTIRKTVNKPIILKAKHPPKLNFSNYFREEINNYPEEEIRLILRQTPNELKELFNVLNTPLDPNMNLTERVAHHYNEKEGYNNEASESEEFKEESVCRSVIRNIYPREANKNNSPVYVPNTQEFMQVIQAEICQYPNQDCNYLQDNLPYGMTSSCQQKYAYKKLLYLDPLEKRMATDLFRYPSCCTCYVRHSPIDLRTSLVGNNNSNNSVSKMLSTDGKQSEPILNNSLTSKILDDNNQPSSDHIQDTEIIHHNTTLTTFKRQPKALSLESNTTIMNNEANRRNSSNKPTNTVAKIPTSTLIEDQIFSNNNKSSINNNSRIQKQTSVAKLLSSSQHTVILQEDKVYKPESSTKRK